MKSKLFRSSNFWSQRCTKYNLIERIERHLSAICIALQTILKANKMVKIWAWNNNNRINCTTMLMKKWLIEMIMAHSPHPWLGTSTQHRWLISTATHGVVWRSLMPLGKMLLLHPWTVHYELGYWDPGENGNNQIVNT